MNLVKKYAIWILTVALVGLQHTYPQYSTIINDVIAVAAAAGLHLHVGNE